MASYHIEFKPSVEKDLRSLSSTDVALIMRRIEDLSAAPLPRQAVKLSLSERLYRIRAGNYRIVYEVDLENKQITIHCVRHRRKVYRDL